MNDLKDQLKSLPPDTQVEILLRRLSRSEQARHAAEELLEKRARELDRINADLRAREEALLERLDMGNRQLLAAQRTARIATMYRAQDGTYHFSPEFAEILGIKAGAKVNPSDVEKVVHPLDQKRMERLASEFFAEHPPGIDHTYDHRIIRPSNREMRWLRWNIRRELGEDQKLVSVFGTVQDITNQRRTERRVAALGLMAERRVRILTQLTSELESAKKSEQTISDFLRAIMDTVPQGIAVFDSDLRLATWNSPLADIIEFDPAALRVGLPFEAPPQSGEDNRANSDHQDDVHRDAEGKIVDRSYERKLRDGRIVQVDVVGRGDGSMVRIYSDITRYKQVEADLRSQGDQLSDRVEELTTVSRELRRSKAEAEKANRYKSRFLAMMSHDIRTPMNGILGMLDTLADSELNSTQARQLELARESGKQLNVLLNDIIEIVRAEAGKLELQPVPLPLARTVEGISEFWRVANANPKIEISCEIGGNLPARAMLDPTRFRQLIDNLLSNAIKYAGKGKVRLRAFSNDANLRIEVVDEGPGISEEQQEKLFMDFKRLQSIDAAGGQSAGLGLAICRRLVEAMNGKIGVSSKVGKGSTFWFEIPLLAEADTADSAVHDEGPAAMHMPFDGLRVLVAEDVETNREVVKAILEQMGCSFGLAENGREALSLLEAAEFDLILMDVNMPKMDGIAATRAIRTSGASYQHIPIVGVTAHVMSEEQDKLLSAGMNALVPKPIDRAMLYATIEDLIGNSFTPPKHAQVDMLDMDALGALLDALPEARRNIILSASIQDITKLTKQLLAAHGADDEEEVHRAAHSLKGVAGNIGAARLADALRDKSNVDPQLAEKLAADTVSEIRRRFELDCDTLSAQ